MIRIAGIVFLAVLCLSAAPIENVLSFQGKLVEGGTPVDGTRNIVFRLYDTETGGGALWEESHPGVPVAGGLFNVELGGSVNFAGAGVSFDEQYWIGISVGGGAEVSPRYKLTSSAYSMNRVWEVNGSDIYCNGGNVGIGITTPDEALHIYDSPQARLLLESDNSSFFVADCGGMSNSGILFTNAGTTKGIICWSPSADQLQFSSGDAVLPEVVIDTDGNVGIGTMGPTTTLDVDGDIRATGKIRPDEYTENGVPICYGCVSASGTLTHGTSNITSVVWESASNQYKIDITGGFNYSRNAWVVTPYSHSTPVFATAYDGGVSLYVKIWDLSGTAVQSRFSFVVYDSNF